MVLEKPFDVLDNVNGTDYIFRLASRYGKRVLLSSSSEVYGKGCSVPFSEDDDRLLGPTTKGRWVYSCSKSMSEFLAFAYAGQGLSVVVARLFNTVGPRQVGSYGMVVPRFVESALKGDSLRVFGDGQQTRCFSYVGDVVDALVGLVDSGVVDVFNVGSSEEVSIEGLARRVIDLSGSSSDIVYVPYEEVYGSGFEDMRRRVPDISKIGDCIGWEPFLCLDDILGVVIDDFS